MPQRSCRRFTILDGMILIAAISLGLAWSGRTLPDVLRNLDPLEGKSATIFQRVAVITALALPTLIAVTLALIVLRMRRPRPTWRHIARQPGMSACCAAAFWMLICLIVYLGALIHSSKSGSTLNDFWTNLLLVDSFEIMAVASPVVGMGVLAAWFTSLTQRTMRCEPSWIDRSGRITGIFWIAATLIIGSSLIGQL